MGGGEWGKKWRRKGGGRLSGFTAHRGRMERGRKGGGGKGVCAAVLLSQG